MTPKKDLRTFGNFNRHEKAHRLSSIEAYITLRNRDGHRQLTVPWPLPDAKKSRALEEIVKELKRGCVASLERTL